MMNELQIYSDEEILRCKSLKKVKLFSYINSPNAPYVLILPGGRYDYISDFNEGKPFAEELNKIGINAFVLFYSTGKNAEYPNAVGDVVRAVDYINENYNELSVKKDFALMGFSAGGHLAAYFAAVYSRFSELRPKALVLGYPVITMGEYTHRKSRENFLGVKYKKMKIDEFSVEKLVTEIFPPTFIMHNEDDKSVSIENSKMLAAALNENDIEFVCDFYKTGGHGVGLGTDKECFGWFKKAEKFMGEYL
ncbi:MAG: alpha/beta hydrolase [Candidatus Fimenecus sp.]